MTLAYFASSILAKEVVGDFLSAVEAIVARSASWKAKTAALDLLQVSDSASDVQSGAADRGKGFVTCFLRVPQAAGLNRSCHAAQASRGNFQKTCYKTFS